MLAEYIWVDGSSPYRLLRSKTRVFKERPEEFPLWNFDGSSTNQAEGNSSDCVLRPVFVCDDPLRYDAVLVLCDVLTPDMEPHSTNTRVFAQEIEEKVQYPGEIKVKQMAHRSFKIRRFNTCCTRRHVV